MKTTKIRHLEQAFAYLGVFLFSRRKTMSTTIELREIFKLAHHDIANKVFERYAEEIVEVELNALGLEVVIEELSVRIAQIYQEELKNELFKNANKVIERNEEK
jgi:hypothetical protein